MRRFLRQRSNNHRSVSLFATRLPENIEVMGHSSAAVRLRVADVASDNPLESEDFISEAWTPEWFRRWVYTGGCSHGAHARLPVGRHAFT